MDKQTNTNTPATYGFRIVFRGRTSDGTYKRAVRTVHATDFEAASKLLAAEGEALAKSCKASCGVIANRVHIALPVGM